MKSRLAARSLLVLIPLGAAVIIGLWAISKGSGRPLEHASVSDLKRITQRDSGNQPAFYYLGKKALETGDPAQAYDAFGRAVELDADDEQSWLGWARAAAQVKGEREAFAVLTLYVRRHPDSARAHLALAQLFGHMHADERAYQEAMTATKLAPMGVDSWRLAGEEALQLHQFTDAAVALERAVALAPRDWRSQTGLGNALLEIGRKGDAMTHLREAVRLAPGEAAARLALGVAVLRTTASATGLAEAEKNLAEAVRLDPRLSLAQLYLGKCYAAEGRWKDAKSALEKAERQMPADAQVHFQLASVYAHLGETAEANREKAIHARLYQQKLESDALRDRIAESGDPKLMLKRARLLAAHGDYGQAAAVYRGVPPNSSESSIAGRELADLERNHSTANSPTSRPLPESGRR